VTTEKPTNQSAGESQWPFNQTPLTSAQKMEMQSEALRKAIRHLLPHLRGGFLVGTSVSASERVWSSYTLTENDADNLMLAVMLPSELAHWTRAVLEGHLDTDGISTSDARGRPKKDGEFLRAMQSSVTELNEFFERWILMGHFVTEFDCLEPVLYAHRPKGEDLVDFLRPAIFAVNHACMAWLGRFGFSADESLMQLVHEHVEDLVDLYPDPEPEDAAEYLRRLLLNDVQFDPEEALRQTKWMPGLGDWPPPAQEG
jgi:hypothetical protein